MRGLKPYREIATHGSEPYEFIRKIATRGPASFEFIGEIGIRSPKLC